MPRSGRDDRLFDPSRILAVAAAGNLPDDAATGLQRLVDDLAEALPGATVAINLIWTDVAFLLAGRGMPDWIMEAGGVPVGWAPCALVVQHERPLIIADTHHDPEHVHNPVVTSCGVRSYAGVPLSDGNGELIGTVIAMHSAPGAFGDDELRILAGAAAQATLLLPCAP